MPSGFQPQNAPELDTPGPRNFGNNDGSNLPDDAETLVGSTSDVGTPAGADAGGSKPVTTVDYDAALKIDIKKTDKAESNQVPQVITLNIF